MGVLRLASFGNGHSKSRSLCKQVAENALFTLGCSRMSNCTHCLIRNFAFIPSENRSHANM